jgi:hypothetical protein
MDSKTRHQLEQNELAKWLTHQYKDWIQPNKGWLGYVVLGGLIVIVVIFATARVNTWNRNAEWKQFYAALSSVDANHALELVADSTKSIVGTYARLALAQRQLAEGSAQAFIDKSVAVGLLDKAITSFQRVQKTASDPMIAQEAGFGLGYCWETLAAVRIGDDLTKAEEEYQKVVDRWGDGFMGQRAQKQLALIRQPATKMVLERMAAKVPEVPAGMEGFRVDNFDRDDPFGGGFNLDSMFDQGPAPVIQPLNLEPVQEPEETAPEEAAPTEVDQVDADPAE